jgi:hypothetical protein
MTWAASGRNRPELIASCSVMKVFSIQSDQTSQPISFFSARALAISVAILICHE